MLFSEWYSAEPLHQEAETLEMEATMADAFLEFLCAKRTVDDRAFNRGVLDAVRREVHPGTREKPTRVLELGAGAGSMIARFVDLGLVSYAMYTAIDSEPGLIASMHQGLADWARERGHRFSGSDSGVLLEGGSPHAPDGFRVVVRPVRADVVSDELTGGPWDLLVAHAFLDLVDVRLLLPKMWGQLSEEATFLFTINYDGETVLLPSIDAELEQRLFALYNLSMDRRTIDGRPSGDSRAGRSLFSHLSASGARVLAAGASDWVVHPIDGAYPADEDVFLRHILNTIDLELRDHPELDRERFRGWVAARHRQIDQGELVLISRNLDFFGKAPAKDAPPST